MKPIDRLMIFGASGDLTRKMLIPALYRLEEQGLLDQSILGVALDAWDTERFRKHVSDAIRATVPEVDRIVESALLARLEYLAGDYTDGSTFRSLSELVHPKERSLVYLAIPPGMFETVVSGLAGIGLIGDSRFLVEKPFGRDLASARGLNQLLHSYMDESSIYRIDHYLGKEPVENLLAFRYANPIFDAVWNREYIDHIQITMAESFGVEERGSLYDSLGVVRDVVQNHLLQLVCLLTMDAPTGSDSDAFAEARVRVLRTVGAVSTDHVVLGQYQGYRSIESVAEDSQVPTFIALSLSLDHPRWRDVPIYIRAGKSMMTTATQAVVVFNQPPPLPFSTEQVTPESDQLVFRIGPSDGVSLLVQTKVPGYGWGLATTPLNVDYDTLFGRIPLAYEHVLHDALRGDRSQFAREDAVEEAWRIVGNVIEITSPPSLYRRGTRGPEEADGFLDDGRRWIDPS